MDYCAFGKAVLVFKTTDETIFDTVQKLIDQYLGYYDFDCEIKEDTITVYAWGNEKYSKFYNTRLTRKLKDIESLADGSELDFRDYHDKLWRFVYENGAWKEQSGEIVYHDIG